MNACVPSRLSTIAACAVLVAGAATCRAADAEGSPAAEPASATSAVSATTVTPARVPAPNAVSALEMQREGEIGRAMNARDEPVALPEPMSLPHPASHWATSAELAGDAYRVWLSRGHLDVGMSFDTATRASRPHDVRIDAQGPLMSTLPALSLGMREGSDSARPSSLLARATGGSHAEYSSKVGIAWKPAESQVQFLREGLGMRLDGNERITMKLRKGMLSVYLHRRF